MDEEQQQLVAIFRAEAAEVLDELAQAIESLSLCRGQELHEVVDHCTRLAHNIKGASVIVESDEIAGLAHALEDALTPFRKIDTPPAPQDVELMLQGVTFMQGLAEDEGSTEDASDLASRLSGLGESPGEGGPAVAPTSGAARATATPKVATIRVETDRLDGMMAHVGELLVTRARMAMRTQDFRHFHDDLVALAEETEPSERGRWDSLVDRLDGLVRAERRELLDFGHLASEIGASMKRVRMMPLRMAGAAWRRTVRQAAQRLDKKVRLTIDVDEIELDKLVLDKIREPIAHLLRNAVDHGIDTPDERRERGLPEVGEVLVRAAMRGASVDLEISDDGRGVDPRRIGEAAVEHGLCSFQEMERMGEDQLVAYLLDSGLSTADGVSQVSGRGVGMDVVRRAIDDLGGRIGIVPHGSLGGATFVLTLPISLLSTRGLLARAGMHVYALPIKAIERTLRIATDTVQQVDGTPTVQLDDGEPLRLSWLCELMDGWRGKATQLLRVVVVVRHRQRLGVVVDEVLTEEEYVVKKLPWNLKSVPGVNGGIILADGSLAVAVDVEHLFGAAAGARGAVRTETVSAGAAAPRVLVVDDSMTTRTLERNMLAAAGYDTTVAVDGIEAWGTLREQDFDLLVTDVRMPGMDGFELTKKVRSDARLKELPVILVTSLDQPEDVARGASAGADEYVVKGKYDQKRLIEAVARLLGSES